MKNLVVLFSLVCSLAACGETQDVLSDPASCSDAVELSFEQRLPPAFTFESDQLSIPPTEVLRASVDLQPPLRLELLDDRTSIRLLNLPPTEDESVIVQVDDSSFTFQLLEVRDVLADNNLCRIANYTR